MHQETLCSSLLSGSIGDLGALHPVELCRYHSCRLRNKLVFLDPTETILLLFAKCRQNVYMILKAN